jgi:hypothetical protein
MKKFVLPIVATFALVAEIANQLHAQGTVFTYQGQLNDGGQPANGTNYGMVFYLYDAPTNGNALGNLGIVSVTVSNGLFTTPLSFGSVFDGNPRWLEISVQKGGGGFTTLSPRQLLTPTPYAIMANSASNLLGALPASQLSGTIPANQLAGTIPLTQLPVAVVTNGAGGVNLTGAFYGSFTGSVANFEAQLSTTLSNVDNQIATPLNLGGGTNLNASQIARGTWANAALNYSYQTFFTNYATTTNDVVLVCTGTNQLITLLNASNFPPTAILTVWSDNLNGSVIVTNATGSQLITVPGVGQGLAVYLGPANSPSNSVTLMVHGGHW